MNSSYVTARPGDRVIRPSALDGTSFGLTRAGDGVHFWITTASGCRIPCVIAKAVLEQEYGAAADVPRSWLAAFVAHRQHIDERILTAMAGRDDIGGVRVDRVSGVDNVFMRRRSG